MARIPESEIERLKTDISLLRLVEGQGRKLEKQGKDYATLCPFHDEQTPSLIISPNKNLYHCFGCNAGGTVIDWVMQTEGVSFRHAVELLQGETPLTNNDKALKNSRAIKGETFTADPDHQTVLRRVIDYYHETLKQNTDVQEYLVKRGLNHPELIDHFKLGYANRTLGYKVPQRTRIEGMQMRAQLHALGIMRESGHEHFSGCLVIPVIDEHGTITEVYGRKIRDNLRKGTAYHIYLPGPHHGVLNITAFKSSDEMILCEAFIDALTLWAHGFRNVTSSYGVHGFTEELLQAFIDHNVKKVLIAFDRDDAGNQAAELVAKQLNEHGIDAFRVLVPKGMDINEYALSVQPANKSLELIIRNAEWMGSAKNVNADPESSLLPESRSEQFTEQLQEITEQLKAIDEPVESSLLAANEKSIVLPNLYDIDANIDDHEIIINLENRRYRIRGLEKNTSYEQLKINVLVNRGDQMFVDNLDLYSARQRQVFIKQACSELGVSDDILKNDLGKLLLKLEALQDQHIKDTLTLKDKAVLINDDDAQAAMNLLKSPDLLQRVLDDFNRAGVVGEETNKLVGYLSCVSRKLDKPLAVIIQSSSAAGKSSLMDAILNLMPEEERVQYSAMTGQSLFYMGETNLKHKILAISEEEGAEQASYALKILQSDGELTIASTGKNDTTGDLVTKEYRVEGPVMIFLTTTAIDIDEELMNRCIVLSVNESREQTQAIHAMQRKQQTLEGLLQSESKKDIINLHRNAQRLLRPLLVANPFAEQLTFIDDRTRTRRDHMKYLTLIKTIALLHQHQRDIKTVKHGEQILEYIEVEVSDIEVANTLAHDILGRTLDELPPQTRKLLTLIDNMVKQQCEANNIARQDLRFTRREIREHTQWGNTQLKVHLRRLEEMEYLLPHRGSRGQSFVYELLFNSDGQDGKRLLHGLIDVQSLKKCTYDEKKSGVNINKAGSSRPQVGPKSGGGRVSKKSVNAMNKAKNNNNGKNPTNAVSSSGVVTIAS